MWFPSRTQWIVICGAFFFAIYVNTRGIGPVAGSGVGITVFDNFYFFSGFDVTILTTVAAVLILYILEQGRRRNRKP